LAPRAGQGPRRLRRPSRSNARRDSRMGARTRPAVLR
jgi:hypothetical protein